MKKFFDGISDEDKKSLAAVSAKLHEVLKEKHKLLNKCAGLEAAKVANEEEMAKMKNTESDNIELILSHKKQMSALKAKVAHQECIVEDAERTKAQLAEDHKKLSEKVAELK